MFGFLAKIGQKIAGGMKLGGKILGTVGGIGQKISQVGSKAFDVAAGIPLVGAMIDKSPLAQGLRGVVGGIGKIGGIASSAGSILEGGSKITDPSQLSGIIEKGRKLGRMGQAVGGEVGNIRRGAGQARSGARSAYGGARKAFSHHFNRRSHEDDRGTTRHG